MDPILEICRSRNLPVIEDCAQAHGAEYKGRRVGTMGELAAFSTMFGKHHATGGQGGVVFTKREDLYWRCRQASDRGKPFGVENPEAGNVLCSLNLNLNDLSACIGRVQLRRLPDMLARLREIGRIMTDGCAQTESVRVNNGLPETDPAYWFIMFKIDAGKLTVGAPDFVAAVQAEGIPASQGYVRDVANMPWYKNRAVFGTSGFPWTSPLYKGDPNAEYPVPNAEAADAMHMRIRLHESVTPDDGARHCGRHKKGRVRLSEMSPNAVIRVRRSSCPHSHRSRWSRHAETNTAPHRRRDCIHHTGFIWPCGGSARSQGARQTRHQGLQPAQPQRDHARRTRRPRGHQGVQRALSPV